MINNKKSIKALISLFLIITLISSIWIGIGHAYIPGQSTVSPNANYITFEGTAANDSYSSMQYSYVVNQWAMENGLYINTQYQNWGNISADDSLGSNLNPGDVWFNAGKSLRVGMTEFGEFADQGNTGIAYGASATEFGNTESWASTAINQAYMVQGWVFYMNYSRFFVQRQIEAYAIYSDTSTAESARKVFSWDGNSNPATTGTGIVTAGTLTPSGIQVLYDSARLGVARVTTVIIDGFYHEAVAQVTLTLIFDKTTKYAIVYYDVKLVLDPKVLIAINDFVFQKKYEIDLARNVNPSNAAFVHYFNNTGTSVYQHPLVGTSSFDVVQAYDPAHQYLFFDGVWPNATQFSVANALVPVLSGTISSDFATATRILPSLNATGVGKQGTQVADIPTPLNEPNTPVITIQWNYTSLAYPHMTEFLAKAPNREIRFVDVYGMTDYNHDPHPAIDANDTAVAINSTYNQIDTEILYLVNQVFNPVDLTNVGDDSPLWVAVGAGSAATDSAGAAAVSTIWDQKFAPLGLFDTNDSLPGHLGSIPFGLAPVNTTSYTEIFNNKAHGSGNDATTYQAFGLINFAWGTYDDVVKSPPQPVSGGFSNASAEIFNTFIDPHQITVYDEYFWYPSKDPLTERWIFDVSDNAWALIGYSSEDKCVWWDPNGIITVGGEKANAITRYFNDFNFAIDREGTAFAAVIKGNPQTTTGSAPSSLITGSTLDFFPLSTWNTSAWNSITQTSAAVNTYGFGPNTAIISIAIDNNGTRGITVAGWNARDTYWASAWAAQFLNDANNDWIPYGTVSLILQMTYPDANSEPTFNIAEALGTITQFGFNYFTATYGGFDGGQVWNPNIEPAWSALEKLQAYDLWTLAQVPPTPAYPVHSTVWYFEKLPTMATAQIEFDGPAQ